MKPLKASDTVSRIPYKPTKEDLLKLKQEFSSFKVSGDFVFHTLQGEGTQVGKHTTFVRLHNCNLKCSWCDSWYTWKSDTSEYYSEPTNIAISELDNVIKKAQADKGLKTFIPSVVFTGGEPLLQQMKIVRFMEMHPEYKVQIETNGTILPLPHILENAYINCSPKLANSDNEVNIRVKPEVVKAIASIPNSCFKFVCATEEDIEEVLETYGSMIPNDKIYIMAEGVTKEENAAVYDKIIGRIIAEGLNTTPRFQNVLYDGAKRGV